MSGWQTRSTKKLFKNRIVELESRVSINPRNGNEAEYVVASFPEWCNVVALTPEKEIVLIRHYRHGSGQIEAEFPGGCVDLGESPLDAAVRELQEETGFIGDKPILIGDVFPNPALQTNKCHTVLITNAKKTTEQKLDDGEDIEVFLKPTAEIAHMIKTGKIKNCMIITAFYFYELYRRF